jgi:hypothetical protein
MRTRLPAFLTCLFISIFGFTVAVAQQPAQPFSCSVPAISAEQARTLTKEAQLAFQLKRASGSVVNGINYVPIRPHIVRRSDGTGGLTIARLNKLMATTNKHFIQNGVGIQFYFAGATPDYIDNDNLYSASINLPSETFNTFNVTNALNQYYTTGGGGYAAYPFDAVMATISVIGTSASDAPLGNFRLGDFIIPHELGHSFNLFHTFAPDSGTDELVTRGVGSNCTTAGDFLCDTPADPLSLPGSNIIYVNGCPQYDPNSTARDANGQAFTPSASNIMSYFNNTGTSATCTTDFTPGQQQRMLDALALRQTHTTYTLDAPATNVTAPSNLTGTVTGLTVTLTWQDNATNEMGYFIERATNGVDFIPVGGVGPNITTFTDSQLVLGGQYTYRIRPSNTTTGSLSQPVVIALTPPEVDGLTSSNVTGTSAQLIWNSIGAGVAHDLQWRQQNTPDWNTVVNLQGGTYNLTGLTTNTPYEWRVKGSTGTVYSDPASFTTTCPTPQYPTQLVARTAATLYWSAAAGQQYTVQWRQQGTATWTTNGGILAGNFQLTNLLPGTPYEWQVSGTCPGSPTLNTTYTPVQSFTTATCPTPTLYANVQSSTSLLLNWYVPFNEPGRTYLLRYRPANTTNWTTISGLTTNSYQLTGLTTSLLYELQVQSVCSATSVSAFSPITTATPVCPPITSLYSLPAATTTKLDWYTNYAPEVGAAFEIQYRPLDTTTWTVVPYPTAGNATTWYTHVLTGLQNGTTYQCQVRTVCPGNVPSTDSPTITFTTNCFAPNSLYTSQVTSTNVSLNWNATTDPDPRFDLQYRPAGSTTWTTISSLSATKTYSTFSYSLTGLVNNTSYEWQVRTACGGAPSSSAYVAGNTFTTTCPPPGWLNTNARTTSIGLSWQPVGSGSVYELRYRRNGNTDWTYISDLSSTTYTITGLQTGSSYELQLRTRCSDGTLSNYSFTYWINTYSCSSPSFQFVSNRNATSAVLNWYHYYSDPTMSFEVRYRPVGSASWTTTTSQTALYGSYSLVVSNLALDTQYEWQVRTLCSETESSGFTSSNLFSTCSSMYTLRSDFWHNSTTWSCGRVPTSTDTVLIKHVIPIPIGYTATAQRILYDPDQRLLIGSGARVRIGQ